MTTWQAVQEITLNGALAYEVGDEVLQATVTQYQLDRLGVVRSTAVTPDVAFPAVDWASQAEMDAALAAQAVVAGSTYVAKRGLITSLPTSGMYAAHRGAGSLFPENSMEGFAGAVALGLPMIEFDCQSLNDGTLGVMHDTTIDRTTTGTGSAGSMSGMGWRTLRQDAGTWFSPAWGNLEVPTVADVLDRFGGKVTLLIEPKSTIARDLLLAEIVRRGLQDSVIVEVGDHTWVATVHAAGCEAFYYWGNATLSPSVATVVATGVEYLGPQYAMSSADIAAIVASGLPCWSHGAVRRVDRVRHVAQGVTGFISDDPIYLRQTGLTPATSDGWSSLTYPHGLVDTLGTRPTLVSPNILRFGGTNIQYAVLGHMSPIAAAAGTYTIDADVRFNTLPADTTRWAGLVVCAADDTLFNSSSVSLTGYHVLLRANGQLQIFKQTPPSTSAQVGSTASTAALVAGAWAHLTIAVTPTSLTVTRTDSAGSSTTTDTAYRGGYLHIGKTSTDGVADFRVLTIA